MAGYRTVPRPLDRIDLPVAHAAVPRVERHVEHQPCRDGVAVAPVPVSFEAGCRISVNSEMLAFTPWRLCRGRSPALAPEAIAVQHPLRASAISSPRQ
jgi:hypothetical protein